MVLAPSRFLYHRCGCFFDQRAQPFKRVRFIGEYDGLDYIPLTVWNQTEVCPKPCPWCQRKEESDG